MSESDAPKIVLVAGRPLTFFVGEFFTELGTSDNCRDNLIRFYDQQFSYIALPLNIRQCKNSMFTEAKYVRILACMPQKPIYDVTLSLVANPAIILGIFFTCMPDLVAHDRHAEVEEDEAISCRAHHLHEVAKNAKSS